MAAAAAPAALLASVLLSLAPQRRLCLRTELYVRSDALEISRAARETAASRPKRLGPTRLTLSKLTDTADKNDFPARPRRRGTINDSPDHHPSQGPPRINVGAPQLS